MEQKDIEGQTPESKKPRSVREIAEELLDKNYACLAAYRAYSQIKNGSFENVDEKVLHDLEDGMRKEAKKTDIVLLDPALCEISTIDHVFIHSHDRKKRVFFPGGPVAVKGFHVSLELIDDTGKIDLFEIVILDGGDSRERWDKLPEDSLKRVFIRNFGRRQVRSRGPSNGYIAFVTDTGKRLIIDEFVKWQK